jgi:membrane associated rhomboid family serine protease
MKVESLPELKVQQSEPRQGGVIGRCMPALLLVVACWLVFFLNHFLLGDAWNQHGIVPRRLGNLSGILFAPFLHASFAHLSANSLPLLVLGVLICLRSSKEFVAVTIGGIIFTGGLTWIFARHAAHVGASGLVFCFFGYLVASAIFKRSLGTVALASVCIIAFGGIIRGVLPTSEAVSWESHLAGVISGIVMARFSSRRQSPEKAY